MTPEQFCYWLQGFFEITDVLQSRPAGLTEKQCQVIRDHLKLAFEKVTPDRSGGGGGGQPKVLNEDEIRKLVIETRPGFTCSYDPGTNTTVNPFDRYCMPGRIC